jgi:hypothetical protein
LSTVRASPWFELSITIVVASVVTALVLWLWADWGFFVAIAYVFLGMGGIVHFFGRSDLRNAVAFGIFVGLAIPPFVAMYRLVNP